jgi:hypothetical protein
MRPNRYEILLWALAAVLVVAPYPATLLASGLTAVDPSCSGFLATSCAPSAWYLFLGQAQVPLICAGLVLVGVALAVRAVTAHGEGGARRAPAPVERVDAADDYDAYRRPPAG